MYEILSPELDRIGEVELVSSDNHSIHWQQAGTLTLIAAATEGNLRNLQNDRFVLIRDTYRQGDRLDGLYVICNVSHDEEKNELTVNGKAAPYLLHQRATHDRVLTGITAGAALAGIVNENARGLPIQADFISHGDPAVIRYPMDGGAVYDGCENLMGYCGIGMEAVLEASIIRIRFSAGRDLSAMEGVPVLGKESGWARNISLSVDSSDFCTVGVGKLIFADTREEDFAVGSVAAHGADRRELYIGEISQQSGESDADFRARASTQANATLAAHLLRTTISADIFPADYGRPYLVGDLVRVQVGAVTLKKRITGATWLHDQSNDRITLTLGDQLYTVVAEIKEQEKANTARAVSASARAGGAAKAAAENKEAIAGIKSDYKALIAQVDNIVAGMDAYVLEKVFEDYKLAVANVFAGMEEGISQLQLQVERQETAIGTLVEAKAALTARVDGAETSLQMQSKSIGDLQTASASLAARAGEAEAKISLNAQNLNGVSSSVATLQADVIKLKGDTEILGNLTIVDGNLKSTRGIVSDNGITGASIYANGTGSQGIISGRRVSCSEVAVGGKEYTPTEITSTSGTVRVLGIA